jgi:hypothetical protein
MIRQQIYFAGAALLVSLAFGFAGLRWAGDKTETSAPISPPASSSDTPFAAGAERSAFVTNAVSSCQKEMAAKEPLGRHLSDDEIGTYCRCYSNGMADAVTAEDVRQMQAGGEPMAIVRDKAVSVLRSCGELLRSK